MPVNETTKNELDKEFHLIFQELKPSILKNYPVIRSCLRTEYGLPDLEPLRYEIGLCLTFGFYQGAITLTNHLLERLLKCTLSYDDALQKQPKDKTTQAFIDWDKEAEKPYNNMNLNDTINRTCTRGYITKEQKAELHRIRETLRNTYSHADKTKQFGKATVSVQAIDFEDTHQPIKEKQNVPLADLGIFQWLFQSIHAEATAMNYYLFIDKLARQIIAKLFPDQK